jgi:hypothetical protein
LQNLFIEHINSNNKLVSQRRGEIGFVLKAYVKCMKALGIKYPFAMTDSKNFKTEYEKYYVNNIKYNKLN